jgi:hypothetical protein
VPGRIPRRPHRRREEGRGRPRARELQPSPGTPPLIFCLFHLRDSPIAQNNGKIAHQVVPHVHFHVIPKPGAEGASHEELAKSGLVIGWPAGEPADKGDLKALQEEILKKLEGAQ